MNRSSLTVESAISNFGAAAAAKLSNVAAGGNPEDQLRTPFERLLQDMAALSARNNVVLIGESSLKDLSLRPDYAVAVDHALAGFVELKTPGKGADPRRFTSPHDKEQGEKLRSLPNVLVCPGCTHHAAQVVLSDGTDPGFSLNSESGGILSQRLV